MCIRDRFSSVRIGIDQRMSTGTFENRRRVLKFGRRFDLCLDDFRIERRVERCDEFAVFFCGFFKRLERFLIHVRRTEQRNFVAMAARQMIDQLLRIELSFVLLKRRNGGKNDRSAGNLPSPGKSRVDKGISLSRIAPDDDRNLGVKSVRNIRISSSRHRERDDVSPTIGTSNSFVGTADIRCRTDSDWHLLRRRLGRSTN